MKENAFSSKRLESLTDGIFAFAMTLLVVFIDLPNKSKVITSQQFHSYFVGQIPEIISYAIAFILLANFWTIHHQQSQIISRTDKKHTWINFLILLFIVLVPFTSAFVGDYSHDWLTLALFGLNLFIVSLLFYLNWSYAVSCQDKLIDKEFSKEEITATSRRLMIVPIVSLLGVIFAFILPGLSTFVYLLIPVFFLLTDKS